MLWYEILEGTVLELNQAHVIFGGGILTDNFGSAIVQIS